MRCWRASTPTTTAGSTRPSGTRRARPRPRESQAETLAAPIERISVIAQPANGEPFLIAPMSAAALERRERLYAGLYFAVGLVSVWVCAWALRHATLPS